MHRRADEPERITKRIFEIAAIRKMQSLVAVREKRDCRRLRLELRRVIKAPRTSSQRRRSVLCDRALENLIELGGAEPLPIAVDDRVDARKNLFDAPSGLRGDQLHRSVGEK